MALSAARDTKERDGYSRFNEHGDVVGADSTQFYKGQMVGINAAGKLVPYTAAAGIKPAGCCLETYLTEGSNTRKIRFKSGIFKWANAASGDAITAADVGLPAYATDDLTVTDNPAVARSFAGMIYAVDTDGVWVNMQYPASSIANVQGLQILVAAVHYESTGTTWDFVGGVAPAGVTISDIGVGIFRLTVAGAKLVLPAGMPVVKRATPPAADADDVLPWVAEIAAIAATTIDVAVSQQQSDQTFDVLDMVDNDVVYVPLAVQF